MNPSLAADAVLFIHAAFVAWVVLSVPAILIGVWRKWEWVHRPAFRIPHCAAILYVAIDAVLGRMCPLTVWENALRQQAGQEGVGHSFIAYWVSQLLFHDLPAWVFTTAYVLFTLLILSLFWIAPIRGKR